MARRTFKLITLTSSTLLAIYKIVFIVSVAILAQAIFGVEPSAVVLLTMVVVSRGALMNCINGQNVAQGDSTSAAGELAGIAARLAGAGLRRALSDWIIRDMYVAVGVAIASRSIAFGDRQAVTD